MQISIDSYIEKLLPWDFTIQYQGVTHATRPLTMGDILLIEEMQRGGGDGAAMQKVLGVLQSLFNGENPPQISQWPTGVFASVLAQLMAYWKDQTKKNMEALQLPSGTVKG